MGFVTTGILLLSLAAAEDPDPAAGIMAKAAANVEQAAEARRLWVYSQRVRSSLVRSRGEVARRERREYSVIPGEKSTAKNLVSFEGEYRKGRQMVAYSEPGFKYKDVDIDGELIDSLTKSLVDSKGSPDGIPASLFPLRTKVLDRYRFRLLGESTEKGRRAHHIAFSPLERTKCLNIGDGADDECDSEPWKGEAWIDAEELQPVRILTELAFKVPWGVRVFLGTNLRQTGFTITYQRVAANVWFPATYGTEFRFNVLWGYKRTVALSLESSDFRRAEASSTIRYAEPD